MLEPDGEHGFIGGTEEAGGLALQGVVQGGQLAGHVGGVALGVWAAAFALWRLAAAGEPAAWTVGPPLFLPGRPGTARAAFFLNAVDPLYVNAV